MNEHFLNVIGVESISENEELFTFTYKINRVKDKELFECLMDDLKYKHRREIEFK